MPYSDEKLREAVDIAKKYAPGAGAQESKEKKKAKGSRFLNFLRKKKEPLKKKKKPYSSHRTRKVKEGLERAGVDPDRFD
jgi:hypothetical protein